MEMGINHATSSSKPKHSEAKCYKWGVWGGGGMLAQTQIPHGHVGVINPHRPEFPLTRPVLIGFFSWFLAGCLLGLQGGGLCLALKACHISILLDCALCVLLKMRSFLAVTKSDLFRKNDHFVSNGVRNRVRN